jgi:hypothetical protein
MAKLTRLTLVQRILSAIDAEGVSTVSETVESEQVAQLLDTAYEAIVADYPWPWLFSIRQLEVPVSNTMLLPSDMTQADWIRYDGKEVAYIEPKEMTVLLAGRNTLESNIDDSGAYNDRDPQYWTSYDDEKITFDSYDTALSTIKTEVYGTKSVNTLLEDTDIPDLPEKFHTTLLFRTIADAFTTLKSDTTNFQIYDKKAKLGMIDMKRWARRINKKHTTFSENDYARKRR